MSKKKKGSRKKLNTTEKILLATAITELIKVVIELITSLIE